MDFLTFVAGQIVMEGNGKRYNGRWVSLTTKTVGMVRYRSHSCMASRQAAIELRIRATNQKVLKSEKSKAPLKREKV